MYVGLHDKCRHGVLQVPDWVCNVVYMTSLVMNPAGMGSDPMGPTDLGPKHPHTQGQFQPLTINRI